MRSPGTRVGLTALVGSNPTLSASFVEPLGVWQAGGFYVRLLSRVISFGEIADCFESVRRNRIPLWGLPACDVVFASSWGANEDSV